MTLLVGWCYGGRSRISAALWVGENEIGCSISARSRNVVEKSKKISSTCANKSRVDGRAGLAKKTGKTYLHNAYTEESKWAPELDVHRSPELDVNTSLKPMSSTDRPGPSSTDRPGTVWIESGSYGWVIGAERWDGDGMLWPTYRNLSTGKATWARPEDVSLSNASAAFDRAVKEWFERKRKTDPAEAQRQEKAGIMRNFAWQPTGGKA